MGIKFFFSQPRTFAPVWDVFKTSTEKLASCHLDLVRRLQELIKEVHKYGDEQIKAYKKVIVCFLFFFLKHVQRFISIEIQIICFWQLCNIWQTKEEVSGTLEAVQNIQSITQALQKSKENYNAKCLEQERLKKEGATPREIDKVVMWHLSQNSLCCQSNIFMLY